MPPRSLHDTQSSRQTSQPPHKRHIRDPQRPKHLTDNLEIAALGLGHVDDANGDGEEGGAAEEEVDARRRAGEEDGGDESDEEVGDLCGVSWRVWVGGDMGEGGTHAVGALAETGSAGAGGDGLDFGGEEFQADCPGFWNGRINNAVKTKRSGGFEDLLME